MNGAAPRFEPRLMDPVGQAPAMWGAWDHRYGDWSREPGLDRARVFTSESYVLQWAARQESAHTTDRTAGRLNPDGDHDA